MSVHYRPLISPGCKRHACIFCLYDSPWLSTPIFRRSWPSRLDGALEGCGINLTTDLRQYPTSPSFFFFPPTLHTDTIKYWHFRCISSGSFTHDYVFLSVQHTPVNNHRGVNICNTHTSRAFISTSFIDLRLSYNNIHISQAFISVTPTYLKLSYL